ncbi:hypothetical protein BJY04DRAFT_219675 [Aspergillus karnatakaensis]|uniref:uncharacterized protein n=1 Tax=Aspergillus karnatakaensis TaxID=1810916 RepID=UPI003CCDB35A
MADPKPLTLIHGPTIRHGSSVASQIRSELMRQRYREKRLRIRNAAEIESAQSPAPRCLCSASVTIEEQSISSGFTTPDSASVIAVCHECHGGQAPGLRALLPAVPLWGVATGRADPFFPEDRRLESFDYLLHECSQVVLPTARPGEFAERSVQAYLHPERSPMVMQSMFYSALLHLRALPILRRLPDGIFSEPSSHTRQLLQIKGAVMNQIRQKLSTVDSNSIHEPEVEDVVLSILHLAANENLDKIKPPETSPFAPPFRRLQSLEFYGSCEYHPLHWQTVQHIVTQRGGLDTLKLYGLSWLISISELLVAVNTDHKPIFPLIYPDGRPFIHRSPLQALEIRQTPRHVSLRNHGFQQLALLDPPIKGVVIRVFLSFTEIAQALDCLANQACGARLLTLIIDTRSGVMHRLCSLPDDTDRPTAIFPRRQCTPEEQDRSRTIYRLCRKTAVLYSANVVLPLPQTSQLRQRMTHEVYAYMLCLGDERKQSELEVLLWCAVIVGICADGTPALRSWFVNEAGNLCRMLLITSWDDLLVLMQSFGWLDCASNEAGKGLWSEIQRAVGSQLGS